MIKKLAVALFAVLMIAGCVTKPIQNVENRPIPLTAQKLSLDRIEALIIGAAQGRGWQVQRIGPGYLVATQTPPQKKFSASVDIRFDQQVYSITHRSSTGLREKDGEIHTRYNNWIVLLQRDIDQRLVDATLAAR